MDSFRERSYGEQETHDGGVREDSSEGGRTADRDSPQRRDSRGRQYVVTIYFPEYPNRMPKVFVTAPSLRTDAPHVYREGNLCYMHPNFWNPGSHDLVFVLAQVAVWLNKYEVWRDTGRWPGPQLMH